MRRAVLAVAATISGLVLLLGFKPHTVATAAPAPIASATGDQTPSSAAPSPSATPAPPDPTAAPADPTPISGADSGSTSASGSFTGDTVATRWGPVQVTAVLTDGKLTDVQIVQVPAENPRDVQINDYAVPILVQESLDADSADIDMVSGATVTSEGYLQSLQSALDQARG